MIFLKTNEELMRENELLKALCKKQTEKIDSLQTQLNWYLEQIKLSKTKQFGNYTETTNEQICIFNEAEVDSTAANIEPTIETVVVQRKKKQKRDKILSKLPVEVIIHDLSEEDKDCPICGEDMHVMSEEIRRELKIIPAQVKIIEHHSYVYSCRNCEKIGTETPVITAPSPKGLIPKSLVSPSMMAYVMNQKFVNAQPLYRQEAEFKRMDLLLSRQTLSNWMIKGASLLKPLADKMKALMLEKDVLHADETVLEVLREPDRPAQTTSYMWLYRTSGCDNPIVMYDYQEGRSGKFAEEYLSNFKGYLHVDGWGGYHRLLEKDIELCCCWAHVRRKFNEALSIVKDKTAENAAVVGMNYCNKLFEIEKNISSKDYKEIYNERQKQSKPVIEAFFSWAKRESEKVLPKSLIGTAILYAIKIEQFLTTFLKDGRIELSNNRAERAIKPFVIGRKNWLFSNTPRGAKSSSIIYSIVETAKENNLKPFNYLEYAFETIQSGNYDLESLLPWSDSIPETCKIK